MVVPVSHQLSTTALRILCGQLPYVLCDQSAKGCRCKSTPLFWQTARRHLRFIDEDTVAAAAEVFRAFRARFSCPEVELVLLFTTTSYYYIEQQQFSA